MYAEFFGFSELPFNNTPDPRFFYSTPDHEEALASLVYAVTERKGFVLLTGEVGAGKTLVTRMMIRRFGAQIAFANINHAVISPEDLMESICTEFDLHIDRRATETQLVRMLHDFLLAQFSQNIPVVLVLDEAQNLSVEGFERLRMIGNLEADDAKLLQIAIVGQPELQRLFSGARLRQLRQRLFRSFHLPALGADATEAYIRHRLSIVTDRGDEIFDRSAVQTIYEASRGLPRLINTVCDNVLLSAYSADRRGIDGAFVHSVVEQMMLDDPRPDRRPSRPIAATPPAQAMPAQIAPPTRTSAPPPVEPPPIAESQPADLDPATLSTPPPQPQRRTPVTAAAAPRPVTDPPRRVTTVERPLSRRAVSNRREHDAIPPEAHSAAVAALRAELDHVKRSVSGQLADTNGRLDVFSRRLHDTSADLAAAENVHGRLASVVKQGDELIARADTRARILDRKEKRMEQLESSLKSVVGDLRELLSRTSRAAGETGDVRRKALFVRQRLADQTRRASTLADQLIHLRHELSFLHDAPPTLRQAVAIRAMQSPTEAGSQEEAQETSDTSIAAATAAASGDATTAGPTIAQVNGTRTVTRAERTSALRLDPSPDAGAITTTNAGAQRKLQSIRASLDDLRDVSRATDLSDAETPDAEDRIIGSPGRNTVAASRIAHTLDGHTNTTGRTTNNELEPTRRLVDTVNGLLELIEPR